MASKDGGGDQPLPEEEGWLQKRSPKGNLIWQKRWCILKGGELSYYKKVKDTSPCGVIPFNMVSNVRGDGDKIVFDFGGRQWHFRSGDFSVGEKWRESLKLTARLCSSGHKDMFCATVEEGDGKWWKDLQPGNKQSRRRERGRGAMTTVRKQSEDLTTADTASNSARDSNEATASSDANGQDSLQSDASNGPAKPTWARKKAGLGGASRDRSQSLTSSRYREGFLSRTDQKLMGKKWYVLNGGRLCVYKTNAAVHLMHQINVDQLSCLELKGSPGRKEIKVEVNFVEPWFLQADNDQETLAWASAIGQAHKFSGGQLDVDKLLVDKLSNEQRQWDKLGDDEKMDFVTKEFSEVTEESLQSSNVDTLVVGLNVVLDAIREKFSKFRIGSESLRGYAQEWIKCIKDVIMPTVEVWDTQPPAQLIKLVDWFIKLEDFLAQVQIEGIGSKISKDEAWKEMQNTTCPQRQGMLGVPRDERGERFTSRFFRLKGLKLAYFMSEEDWTEGHPPVAEFDLNLLDLVEKPLSAPKTVKLRFKEQTDQVNDSDGEGDSDEDSDHEAAQITEVDGVDLSAVELSLTKAEGLGGASRSAKANGADIVDWLVDQAFVKLRSKGVKICEAMIARSFLRRADGSSNKEWDEDADWVYGQQAQQALAASKQRTSPSEFTMRADTEDDASQWHADLMAIHRALKSTSWRGPQRIPDIKKLFDQDGLNAVVDEVQTRTMKCFTYHGRAIEDLSTLLQSADEFLEICCRDLDDLMFIDGAEDLFQKILEEHITRVVDVIKNFCKLNAPHWDAGDTVGLCAWLTQYDQRMSSYESEFLKQKDIHSIPQIDVFIDEYVDHAASKMISMYENLVQQQASAEPVQMGDGRLVSTAAVDAFQIFDQQLQVVLSTRNVDFVARAFHGTLPCLLQLRQLWLYRLKQLAGEIPVECICGSLNALKECVSNFATLEETMTSILPSEHLEGVQWEGLSAAFSQSAKDGVDLVVAEVINDCGDALADVGTKSWLEGETISTIKETLADYFSDLKEWLESSLFRKMTLDLLELLLRKYLAGLVSSKLKCDISWVERIREDIQDLETFMLEYHKPKMLQARMSHVLTFADLYDPTDDTDDPGSSMCHHFAVLVKNTDAPAGLAARAVAMRSDLDKGKRKLRLQECLEAVPEPPPGMDDYPLDKTIDGQRRARLFGLCVVPDAIPAWKEKRERERAEAEKKEKVGFFERREREKKEKEEKERREKEKRLLQEQIEQEQQANQDKPKDLPPIQTMSLDDLDETSPTTDADVTAQMNQPSSSVADDTQSTASSAHSSNPTRTSFDTSRGRSRAGSSASEVHMPLSPSGRSESGRSRTESTTSVPKALAADAVNNFSHDSRTSAEFSRASVERNSVDSDKKPIVIGGLTAGSRSGGKAKLTGALSKIKGLKGLMGKGRG